ncbi:MotA/TolQ/ExbB proton channel family protein [Phenylobacterium sp.]|uniref:MotA/TolQ/ExbB proton channel family protein n=1 Tax=Phenylobacterium sp. TaxID=1871053 RepID=UPI002EDB8833
MRRSYVTSGVGLLGMSYGLVAICIGITNKRPGPTLLALAPGLAKALLSLGLGILAAAIATVAHHHLRARLGAITQT